MGGLISEDTSQLRSENDGKTFFLFQDGKEALYHADGAAVVLLLKEAGALR
jgi:hypothetical protein